MINIKAFLVCVAVVSLPNIEAATTTAPTTTTVSPIDGLPVSVDWRQTGWVSPVQDQGNCWRGAAFAAAGALEGQIYKKYGTKTVISVQNIIDCTYETTRNGCTGGFVGIDFKAIKTNGGVFKAANYPFTSALSGQSGTCQFNASQTEKIGAKVTGYRYVKFASDRALKAAVANIGPIAVGVDATEWLSYTSGFVRCNRRIDHAVLVVGYDSFYGIDYWIVKNSW